MARKAQMEVFVLVGLIFLASSVVYLAYQALTFTPDSVPIGISQEENVLREPISELFKTGAEEALRVIEFQGGYSNYGSLDGSQGQGVTTRFLGGNVRYWLQCEYTNIPDMEDEIIPRFENYIRKFVTDRLQNLLDTSYRDVETDMEDMELDVRFTDSSMITTIRLPVTIENYTLNPEYVITVPTKFKQLLEFAEDFSEDQASNRHLEYFTVSSIYFSADLASQGFLTRCGEAIIQTPTQTAEGLENVISYTLMNTFFWKTAASRMEMNEYYIPTVNGNKYPELNPRINLPDDFRVESFSEPIIILNTEFIAGQFPIIIPKCLTNYMIRYEIVYPYIVSVMDPLSGYLFNFAGLAYIEPNEDPAETLEPNEGMRPGSCEAIEYGDVVSYQPMDCDCQDSELTLEGYDVDDAIVGYGSCTLTYQGNGRYAGRVPCNAVADLYIYKNESYESLVYNDISPDEIGGTYYLHRVPKVTVHYYNVVMDGAGIYSPFMSPVYIYEACDIRSSLRKSFITTTLESGDKHYDLIPNFVADDIDDCIDIIESIDADEIGDECGCTNWQTLWGNCDAEDCIIDDCLNPAFMSMGDCIHNKEPPVVLDEIVFDYIPGGYTYDFEITSRGVHGFWEEGYARVEHTLSEFDHDLYIYVPSRQLPDFKIRYELTSTEKTALMNYARLNCGLDLITETEQPLGRIVP